MGEGAIYLVATPLGNLEDITLRALRTLREADLVACEDTRRTARLLRHFEIDRPLLSCHEHNEAKRAVQLVERALHGESIALVSDAGTPAISDPGNRVVRAALDAGVAVVPVPGPNAAVTALSASGLPTRTFRFLGFLPSKKAHRREAIRAIQTAQSTVALQESPHRVLGTLKEMQDLLGDRTVVIAREMTKIHEEFLRGTAGSIHRELAARPAIKGEFVILVGPRENDPVATDLALPERVDELVAEGLGRMAAIKLAARERGISKREAYARLHSEARSD